MRTLLMCVRAFSRRLDVLKRPLLHHSPFCAREEVGADGGDGEIHGTQDHPQQGEQGQHRRLDVPHDRKDESDGIDDEALNVHKAGPYNLIEQHCNLLEQILQSIFNKRIQSCTV
jgi:hypothetical protein